jgi:sugar lactone lactonase YvrE
MARQERRARESSVPSVRVLRLFPPGRCGSALALTLLAAAAATTGTVARAQQPRPHLDVRLFAHVGPPGQPEGLTVDERGLVYVGTNQSGKGDAAAPSRVFAFDRNGRLVRDYVIRGQDLAADHGVDGLAFDGGGMLYVLDRVPARVLRIDPVSGSQETYATFADLGPCPDPAAGRDCSAAAENLPPFVDSMAFAPNGDLYATDLQQALLWRVPRGGGAARVFFTDARLDSPMGPNGLAFRADARTLLFTRTGGLPQGAAEPGVGALYALPVEPGPRPGALEPLWQSLPADGPDGIAIGRSGHIYMALAGANQLAELSPTGVELARVPSAAENLAWQASGSQVPFDGPASVAFEGERVLVTNQAFLTGDPTHWAVFDVFAGEPGLPLLRPRVAGTAIPGPAPPPKSARARLRLRLLIPGGRRRGTRRCVAGRVVASVRGRDLPRVTRVAFRLGRLVTADRQRPFRRSIRVGPRARRQRLVVRARVSMRGGRRVRLARALIACGSARRH